MTHIKGLDNIRAISVILVLLWHWLPKSVFPNVYFDSGKIGVDFFFVLSGFLITRILLESKSKSEQNGIPLFKVFKNFYARRSLRIFPVYYLTVLVVVLIHKIVRVDITSGEMLSMLTYTINFHFFHMKFWGELTAHFWSLAVEEQFYLVWPFLILLLKKEYILYVILAFISIGFLGQCFMRDLEFGHIQTYTCLDAFGLGALLSWICLFKPDSLTRFRSILLVSIGIGLLLLFAHLNWEFAINFPKRTLRSMVALWIIAMVMYYGDKDVVALRFFYSNRPLIFLGKLSYGMYLFHVPLPWITHKFTTYVNHHLFMVMGTPYLVFLENFVILILVCWLSWIWVEKPILTLKRYFAYG